MVIIGIIINIIIIIIIIIIIDFIDSAFFSHFVGSFFDFRILIKCLLDACERKQSLFLWVDPILQTVDRYLSIKMQPRCNDCHEIDPINGVVRWKSGHKAHDINFPPKATGKTSQRPRCPHMPVILFVVRV